MRRMEKAKYVVMGMVVMGTMTNFVVPAVAKNTKKDLTAIYKNIKIVADGIPVNVGKDEPFICNGTTYLPVRAVGEAMGKKVAWNGNTNTVYLGEIPGEKAYLVDVLYSI